MTTDIIKQRHDAYHTSAQEIFDLARRATGQQAIAREKIVRGYDGVIDFGEFQGGGPILDFANLNMSCPDVDLFWLLRGYGNTAPFEGPFPARLQVTKLGLQIGYLAHYIRQGNAQEAAPLTQGLRETLREWD